MKFVLKESKNWTITIKNFPMFWEDDMEELNQKIIKRDKTTYEIVGGWDGQQGAENTYIYSGSDPKDYKMLLSFAKEYSQPDEDEPHNISYEVSK